MFLNLQRFSDLWKGLQKNKTNVRTSSIVWFDWRGLSRDLLCDRYSHFMFHKISVSHGWRHSSFSTIVWKQIGEKYSLKNGAYIVSVHHQERYLQIRKLFWKLKTNKILKMFDMLICERKTHPDFRCLNLSMKQTASTVETVYIW